jgi:aminoglycoside phosphotransferase (APT) family kinase protein
MAAEGIKLPNATEDTIRELLASLSLPSPRSVAPLNTSKGAYHSIFIISYDDSTSFIIGENKKLVLRISAGELPHTKTMNEVAMIQWIRENTSIPAPAVIAFDHTLNNALHHEYSITEFVSGQPLSEVYHQVKDRDSLVNQLIDYLLELYAKPFDHIGGLQVAEDSFKPGPMTEWHFWTNKDRDIWPDPLSMNAVGPFNSYTAYCIANMKVSKKAIDSHETLKHLRSISLDRLIDAIASKGDDLTTSRFVLTHRDLHFGNIMYDVDQQKITGIIDWELAAILPYQLWNPGNFLWTGGEGIEADEEKARYYADFERLCRQRNVEYLLDTAFASKDQQMMQEATTLLRNLVNAYVRGWQRKHANQMEEELRRIIDALV